MAPTTIEAGRPAGVARRFLGRTIDVALLGVPGALLCRTLFHNWLAAVVLLIPLAVLVYTSVLQSALGGQTLGDRVVGVRVLSLKDGRLSFLSALTRSFVGVFMTSQCAMAL